MKKNLKRKILPFLILFLAAQIQGIAQGAEVCLVYLTSYGCGDDCMLTDTFVDGLLDEYRENLTFITYFVDANNENMKVFESYKRNYNISHDVPILLFGKNDYIHGIDDIYEKTEERIFSLIQMNGTNCPLDSGYIPPSQLGSIELSGQPEIMVWSEDSDDRENVKKVDEKNKTKTDVKNPFEAIFIFDKEVGESILSVIIIIGAIAAVFFIILFIRIKEEE